MHNLEAFRACCSVNQIQESENAEQALEKCLKHGVPATLVLADVPELGTTDQTSLLHAVVNSVDKSDNRLVARATCLIDLLLEWGASWNHLDSNGKTPGCLALDRQLPESIYSRIVAAGVRAEYFLAKMGEPNDSATQDETYLNSRLSFAPNVIKIPQDDGVMMDWERPIMERSAQVLAPTGHKSVLNVGFGLGIMDHFLQLQQVQTHYICEAHPDVLAEMRSSGWYNKPNVIVLEGPWQKCLPRLVEQGVQVDAIYYDTFSEQYSDLVHFFDFVVELLEPANGVFSFFNGLAADRQVTYDVCQQLVELDLRDRGLVVEYEALDIDPGLDVWHDIKHRYWQVKQYKLPVIRFRT